MARREPPACRKERPVCISGAHAAGRHWGIRMTANLDDLTAGMRLSGVVANNEAIVVAVQMHSQTSATLTYRTADGELGERLITVADLSDAGANDEVRQAQNDPERWRLAVISVPDNPSAEPQVRYLVEPVVDITMHMAQTNVPLNVAKLLADATPPS